MLAARENDDNDNCLRRAKAETAIDRLSIIWNSYLSDKIKPDFFQAEAIWIQTKRKEKKLAGNYARMLTIF